MAKRLRIPLSNARARLFELAETVRRGDDTVVVLEQRGSAEGVALLRETQLNYLECRVREIEKSPEKPFRLAGSMSTDLNGDELLALLKDLRRAWDPASPPPPPRRRKR